MLVGSALLTAACQKVPLLAPSGSTITLTASATALPVNGSTDVIAQVIEAGGTPPHSGTLITFTTNLGTVQPSEAETDLSGRVIVKYLAGSGSGTATITAISGGVSASGTNAIKIAVGSAAVGGIALSANPTTLPANGGTTTIAAVVNDSGGNALPGVPVTFSTDNGSLGTSVVTTDTNGRAQTTLATSRTAKVTATAGVATTSGTTTTAASTSTVTVNVNSSATVAFGTFSPATPVAGQPVSFTLTITPSTTGAAIQNVVVNFGDSRSQSLGAVSGATALSHTYDSPGTYTLTATATDSNGDAFPAVAAITVGNRPPANVTIVANPVGPQVGQQVAFTITTTFPSTNTALVQTVAIDFGDGSSAQLGAQTTAIAQHVYQTAGTYLATAIVRDTNGGSTSSQTQVIVSQKAPANVTIAANPVGPQVGQQVAFTITTTFPSAGSTATTFVQSVVIDFGDSSSASLGAQAIAVAQHVYQTQGSYTATATVRDTNGGSTSSQTQVIVTPKPTASVSLTVSKNPSSATADQPISFTAAVTQLPTGVTVDHFEWNFGDTSPVRSTTSTTTNHAYPAGANSYLATVTAVLSDGSRSSSSLEIKITV